MVLYLDEKTVTMIKDLVEIVNREAELRRNFVEGRATWYDDLARMLKILHTGITTKERSQISALLQDLRKTS